MVVMAELPQAVILADMVVTAAMEGATEHHMVAILAAQVAMAAMEAVVALLQVVLPLLVVLLRQVESPFMAVPLLLVVAVVLLLVVAVVLLLVDTRWHLVTYLRLVSRPSI